MSDNEIWKEVPSDGRKKYLVSSSGRFARVLTPSKAGATGKYLYAYLFDGKNNKAIRYFLHRLILTVFKGQPPTDKHECNHKDGNTFNNKIENLEWVTPSENRIHSYKVLGRKGPKGEINGHWGKFDADNLTAKTYVVTNPDGEETTIIGLNKFCKEHELDVGTMSNIARGRRGCKTHHGWKCRYA